MRIRKYDFNYGRRMLLEKGAQAAAAGVLAPLWSVIPKADADITKAYPDELLSIDMYTKGKIKPGDVLTENNVDVVKDLLDPITYDQVKTMGRKINIVESTRDVTKLMPYQYLDATLKHKGNAVFGPDGNVWNKTAGTPWNGGNPFPDAKTGVEAMANVTMSWGRHNYSQYAIAGKSLAPDGSADYVNDYVWVELNATARPDGTIWQNRSDILRFQSVWFTAPNDVAGTSFLNTWYYDQRKFPDLYGYLPAFKRVRQFPTNQRFEPLLPGMTFFLSDAWAAGDPMLTWGNYKIVGRQPMLGAFSSQNFRGGYDPNWQRGEHGGPKGKTFYNSWFELIPECIVIETEPTGYPRAPVGKRKIWFDVRSGMWPTAVSFDRRGQVWKQWEAGFAQYSNEHMTIKDATDGHPVWSWTYVHSYDAQAQRMTLLEQAKQVTGGYQSTWWEGNIDVYNKYLTVGAIQRLGQA